MGLFDKKFCDICGEKIGLLGNRKLEDGNLCKHCAAKLSPWFSERRQSTVEEIKQQLAYREANQADVNAFTPTLTLGERYKVLIDENQGKFIVSRDKNWREENPDVLSFSMVTGCNFDIDESRTEEMRTDPNGEKRSFMPPHYEYSYDFSIILSVNHPYFSEMKFQLNDSSVDEKVVGSMQTHGSEYQKYVDMMNEIKNTLMNFRQEARNQAIEAATPKGPVKCPSCGATTTPDATGCCEFCGSPLN